MLRKETEKPKLKKAAIANKNENTDKIPYNHLCLILLEWVIENRK